MGVIMIKTNYGRKLEEAFVRMYKSRKRVVRLKDKKGFDGIHLQVQSDEGRKYGWKPSDWWITKIGCNSFGIEVWVQNKLVDQWVAIEQLTSQQQLRIANAIDWSTLE